MMSTSAMPGTLVSSYSPSASSVAAISLSTEFLAPGTSTSPCSGPARRTTIGRSGISGSDARWSATGPDLIGHQYAPPVPRSRSNGHSRCGPPTRTCAAALERPRDDLVLERGAGDGTFDQARRAVSRVPAPSSHGARTAARRDAPRTGSSIPWFGWLFALPVRALVGRRLAPPDHARRVPGAHAVVGAARPARRTPDAACSDCSPRRRCSSAFVNTLFTQTVNFAADDFGIGEHGRRRRRRRSCAPGSSSRCRRRPRRPHRPPAGRSRSSPGRRRSSTALGALGADVPGARRDTDHRPPARPRPRLARRRRRRRGDAAQQPRLRGQRAGDGERARRRHRRDRAAARRHRRSGRGGSCTSCRSCGWSSRSTSRGACPRRRASSGRTRIAPPLDRRRFADDRARGARRQPLRRPGQLLPEQLPREVPRLLGAGIAVFTLIDRDAGRHRLDHRRPDRRHPRPAARPRRRAAVAHALAVVTRSRSAASDVVRGVRRRVHRRHRLPRVRGLPHRAVPDRQPRPRGRSAHRGGADRRDRRCCSSGQLLDTGWRTAA